MRLYALDDGSKVPSVTTILGILAKPALEAWQRKHGFPEADRQRDVAAKLGKRLHRAVELFNLGRRWDTPALADLGDYLDGYARWYRDKVERVVYAEQTVLCACHRFGGTEDTVYLLKGHALPVVADNKTSRRSYREWGYQVAAYAHALGCNLGLQTSSRRLVLRFDKDQPGVIEECWYDDGPRDWRLFLCCLLLWYAEHGQQLQARPIVQLAGNGRR